MVVRDLTFTSPDPPEVVLGRLRALGAEWRMSARPAALAGTPAGGIRVRLTGAAFRLAIRAWAEPHAPRLPVECVGRVVPEGGGARLTAEVRHTPAAWATIAVGTGAAAVWLAAAGAWLGALFIAAGAAGGVAATLAYHRPTTEVQADAFAQALAAAAVAGPSGGAGVALRGTAA